MRAHNKINASFLGAATALRRIIGRFRNSVIPLDDFKTYDDIKSHVFPSGEYWIAAVFSPNVSFEDIVNRPRVKPFRDYIEISDGNITEGHGTFSYRAAVLTLLSCPDVKFLILGPGKPGNLSPEHAYGGLGITLRMDCGLFMKADEVRTQSFVAEAIGLLGIPRGFVSVAFDDEPPRGPAFRKMAKLKTPQVSG